MSDPFYRSPAWRRLRTECLRRQPTCATPGCGKPATVADHIVPRSKGGADTLANLRGVCAACHNSRTARGNADLRVRGCDAAGWPLDPRHPWQGGGGASIPGADGGQTVRGHRAQHREIETGG